MREKRRKRRRKREEKEKEEKTKKKEVKRGKRGGVLGQGEDLFSMASSVSFMLLCVFSIYTSSMFLGDFLRDLQLGVHIRWNLTYIILDATEKYQSLRGYVGTIWDFGKLSA